VTAPRVRAEPFGAWVRLEDSTLVAVDRALARRLGVDGGDRWTDRDPPTSAPLEVHVAVTSRCPVACSGCYQDASLEGVHVDRGALEATLRDLAARGVFTVAFGGGEPLLRDDLGELATGARSLGLTPVVTTSGLGLTPAPGGCAHGFRAGERLPRRRGRRLRRGAGLRGRERRRAGHRDAPRGQGIAVGVNHVLTRQNVDGLREAAARVRELGARELQLLRYKPAGRAASLDYLARRLRPEDLATLGDDVTHLASWGGEGFSVRIDCALVPLLSDVLGEAEQLTRFGVFGCEAGRHLGAVKPEGTAAGCSFVTPMDGSPAAFRAYANDPDAPCRDCDLRAVCRGGCKVVSLHLEGRIGADPECPRVRRARGLS
jgi:radical SAM protein with 4Fe4S-binding SPASM domain